MKQFADNDRISIWTMMRMIMSMMLRVMMVLQRTITMTTDTTIHGVFGVGLITIERHKIGHSTLLATGEHWDIQYFRCSKSGL